MQGVQGDSVPLRKTGTRSVPPGMVSKQWRQIIRWMICRNAFAAGDPAHKLQAPRTIIIGTCYLCPLHECRRFPPIQGNISGSRRYRYFRVGTSIIPKNITRGGKGHGAIGELRIRIRAAWGPAKAGRISIHWMETASLFAHLPGGTLRVPVLRGPAVHGPSPFVAARHFPRTAGESSPVPAGLCPDPRFFEKNRVKLLYCATPWQRERHSREASAERDATYVQA